MTVATGGRLWLGGAALLCLAALAACGGFRRHRGPEGLPRKERVQVGIASWYGKEFHGKPTASGEPFDMYDLTAAHRTLPLGSRCKVTNLENGRETVLRINDRGPFVRGRILDCSYGAAQRLGFAGKGLARVRVEVLEAGRGRPLGQIPAGEVLVGPSGPPARVLDGSYTVQVGAFLSADNATRLRDRLKERHPDTYVVKFHDFYRVRVGHLATEEEADDLQRRLAEGGLEGFVTRNE
jgi:rare lipoprotein A